MVHDGFLKWGYHNNGKSVNILLKRMIWGYLHFRKPKTIEFLNWWVTSFFTTVLQHFSTSPVLQVSLQSVPTENSVDEGSSLGAAGNGPFLGFVVGIPDLGLNKMMAKIFGKPSNTTLFHGLTMLTPTTRWLLGVFRAYPFAMFHPLCCLWWAMHTSCGLLQLWFGDSGLCIMLQ